MVSDQVVDQVTEIMRDVNRPPRERIPDGPSRPPLDYSPGGFGWTEGLAYAALFVIIAILGAFLIILALTATPTHKVQVCEQETPTRQICWDEWRPVTESGASDRPD